MLIFGIKKMGKFFGTDGIRGRANAYPMTAEMAVKIGKAVASFFTKNSGKIIIGKDTRISSDMLECSISAGICSMGKDVYLTGILPTPGIAFLTASTNADAGIVISASHNPFYDNGIKIFGSNGFKLSDEIETKIGQLIDQHIVTDDIQDIGIVRAIPDAVKEYAYFLKQTLPYRFDLCGIKILMDCANGATFQVAPRLFADIGAAVTSASIYPNGKNINESCGSEHPNILKKMVMEHHSDIGLAFDGDGDRLIAIDEKGNIVTGDQILAICAASMKKTGMLKNNIVVSTVMSNIGLGIALKRMGISHIITDVGDRYVMAKMLLSGAVLGGEDSGHMIFLNHHTTGDGILTALKLIEAMESSSKPLSELANIMTVFPQELINVEVASKPDIKTIPQIQDAIRTVEQEIGENGRVLVRYSGTQMLCRVMVEGPTRELTRQYCNQIADIIHEKIGC